MSPIDPNHDPGTSNSQQRKSARIAVSMKKKNIRMPCTKSKVLQGLFNFVRDNTNKYAVCKSCDGNPRIKMTNSNTTGVKRHVQRFHREHYKEAYNITDEQESGNSSIEENFSKMIVQWISLKYLPLDFFEDQQTQELFHYLNSKMIFPSKAELEILVQSTYEKMKNAIQIILGELNSKVSFTIDGWTTVENKTYYGITAHFIDKDWQFQSIVLSYAPSKGKNCGKNIANIFYNVLNEYNLLERIQSITVDNVVANSTFMDELKIYLERDNIDFDIENQYLRCLAHIFNVGVQGMLKSLGANESNDDLYKQDDKEKNLESNEHPENLTVLQTLRELFIKVQNSENLQNLLKSCCALLDIIMIELNFDFCTRWNSTFLMIKAAVQIKSALIILCENNKEVFENLILDPLDWTVLTEVYKILRSFETISSELGGNRYTTLPMSVLGFNMLLDMLDNKVNSLYNKENSKVADEVLISALETSRDRILEYYQKTNWIYCIALILDPRHKVETFDFTNWGKKLQDMSVQKFEELFKTKYYIKEETEIKLENIVVEEDDILNVSSMFECETTAATLTQDWKKEINEYLSTKRAEKNQDILMWWRRHASIYPNLSRMAADILSTPATSIPTEMLFSQNFLTVRKQRNGLEKDSAALLLCLNSWFSRPISEKIQNALNNELKTSNMFDDQ